MQAVKIVINGAYSAGKTSFIRSVSDIDIVSTEYDVTDPEERKQKAETTVALDFGTIAINEDITLYLFGTPGQERFDFMWEVLSVGCIGYVVVDSCRPSHLLETQRLMDRFAEITDAPFVIAANKQDDPAALPISYLRRRMSVPATGRTKCLINLALTLPLSGYHWFIVHPWSRDAPPGRLYQIGCRYICIYQRYPFRSRVFDPASALAPNPSPAAAGEGCQYPMKSRNLIKLIKIRLDSYRNTVRICSMCRRLVGVYL